LTIYGANIAVVDVPVDKICDFISGDLYMPPY